MMGYNVFDKNDFNDDHTIWKGKPREVSLDGWVFDRYNNAFYKTGLAGLDKELDGDVLYVGYNKDKDTWESTYAVGSNIIWEDSVSSDNFGDIIEKAETFLKEYKENIKKCIYETVNIDNNGIIEEE